MVRINLVNPKKLSDQHLIAEYDEILMLTAYIKKYPKIDDISCNYVLGKGHMKFFKNKLKYLKNRHELLKKEMKNRCFKTNKTIKLKEFPKNLINDWKPNKKDLEIIKKRIINRLNLKSNFYRYYGEYKSKKFFVDLINS